MPWDNPTSPNLPDFIEFVQNMVGVDPLYLPADSPFYGYALAQAQRFTIRALGGPGYTLAVYNAGAHILLTIAPDQTGRTWFRDQRATFGLNKPVSSGLVQSTGDDGTSVTLAVPDALRNLTLGDLMMFRTPWGQEALAYNQDFGSVFGIS